MHVGIEVRSFGTLLSVCCSSHLYLFHAVLVRMCYDQPILWPKLNLNCGLQFKVELYPFAEMVFERQNKYDFYPSNVPFFRMAWLVRWCLLERNEIE